MKKPMKFKRYERGGEIDEMEEANKAFEAENRQQIVARRRPVMDSPMEQSRKMQNLISVGSDFQERSQDEGYRPFISPEDRAKAKLPRKEMGDASVAETTGQFGDAGTGRVVAPTPKAMPKPTAKLIDPSNIRSGRRPDEEAVKKTPALIDPSNIKSGRRDYEDSQKTPVDETKLSLTERMKLSRARSKAGSGPTDRRSVSERIRSSLGMKSGGSVSSASRRADGIATKGKTRGKIC